MQPYSIQSVAVKFGPLPAPRMATDIIRSVALAFAVSVDDLKSPRKHRRLAYPRFAAYKIIRDRRGLSYERIAMLLGRTNHKTVMHGIWQAKNLLEADPGFADAYRRAAR